MKKMKKFEMLMYLCYGLAFTLNLISLIETKDGDKLAICIWIINAGMMFSLYRDVSKFGDKRVETRDNIIKNLFKIIHEAEEKMDSFIANLENVSSEAFEKIIKDLDSKKYHVYREVGAIDGVICVTKWAIYKKDMPTQEYFSSENVAILSSDKDNYLDLVNFVSENKIENVEE